MRTTLIGLGALLLAALFAPPAFADERERLLQAEVDAYLASADATHREGLLLIADIEDGGKEKPETGKPWEFVVGVHLWIPWTDAFVGKDSIVGTGEIDVDPSDGQFGYRVTADARRGKWGVFFDGLSMNLHDSQAGVRTKLEQLVAQLGGFFRCGTSKTIVDTMLSVRTFFFDTELLNGSVKRTWWEPAVGVRVTQEIMQRLHVVLRGDIGGFALGSASDLTYSIEGSVTIAVSPLIDVAVGYRYLDIDYSNGGLAFRERVRGPFLAVFFSW